MSNYYISDPIWSSFKVENREDYLKNYVIKGNFHSGVHKDVIASYQTVEYLMAHAYYCWQFYDQVLVKLLVIFEMAVKLRSKDLNNPLEYQDRKGKIHDKKLVVLIEELENYGYPISLIKSLDWLRKLRNIEAHPDRNNFAGAIKKQAVIPWLNIINRLFLNPEKLTIQEEKTEVLLKTKNILSKDIFIYSHNEKNILVHNLELLENLELANSDCEYWKANPILIDTFESYNEMKFATPFLFFLTNVHNENGNLIATDFHTNKSVQLIKTNTETNIKKHQNHINDLNRLDQSAKISFESMQRNHLNTHWEEFIYKNAWTNQEYENQ